MSVSSPLSSTHALNGERRQSGDRACGRGPDEFFRAEDDAAEMKPLAIDVFVAE
jgi:hypothetical protein